MKKPQAVRLTPPAKRVAILGDLTAARTEFRYSICRQGRRYYSKTETFRRFDPRALAKVRVRPVQEKIALATLANHRKFMAAFRAEMKGDK